MIPTCLHFQQTNLQGGGLCKIGKEGGSPPAQPAYRTCARCLMWEGPGQAEFKKWRAAGDTQRIAPLTATIRTPPPGSAEHQAMLAAQGKTGCNTCGDDLRR
jgi:hypothetical protein